MELRPAGLMYGIRDAFILKVSGLYAVQPFFLPSLPIDLGK
jgi:hypothetical protein